MSKPPEPSPPALEQLGIYRVESLLGPGGMGEVYLAWDELLQRRVAIKRVRTDRLRDETQRKRFLREARAVARLDHPSIVRIHHILERDDCHCLVMEHIEGQDLAEILKSGMVSLVQAATFGREIAAGLAAAHDQGLVHRDLKPANVMVFAGNPAESPTVGRSGIGHIKILDFGLAKSLPDVATGEHEDEITRTDVIVGTAHAMSPEQASGLPVDHRSDLFALGSLLYELLSGQAPFRGANVMDSLRRVLTAEPEPISKLLPGLHPGLADLVTSLLHKDPAARPASAHQVAERLGDIAASLSSGSAEPDADPDSPTAELLPALRPSKAAPASAESRVLRTVVHVDPAAGVASGQDAADTLTGAARGLLTRFNATEAAQVEGVYLFHRPAEAVAFALLLHRTLEEQSLAACVGIHLGEVVLPPAPQAARPAVGGETPAIAAALARRARARQTLLGRGVFDLVRGAHSPEELTEPRIRWLAHGTYLFDGHEQPFEIFEVGVQGFAPLVEPPDSDRTQRAPSNDADRALGWRPAAGQAVPRRANWKLVQRLGEGGFGEVWLARHTSGDERVFKFCFELERLRSLKREVTLFRLMRETLGHRRDIARLLEWDFDEAPYFLESEYGVDLERWAERRGGIAAVPPATRLELTAGIAEALAAAHSVGILHKDVKPSNVLIGHDPDGRPYARLADFGIGMLTEKGGSSRSGITMGGFTETALDDPQGGTARYMAPELLVGKPATVQADVYALGVTFFQLVVGDFERPIAPGWRREVDDELLAEDIAACVDGSPERRLRGPAELAERLRSLTERRQKRQEEEQALQAAERAARRRQMASTLGFAAAIMMVVISVFAYQAIQARDRELEARQNAEQRRRQAESLIDFMLGDLRTELQPLGKLAILDKIGDQAMEYFAAAPEGGLSDEETASYARALHQIGQVRFALGEMSEAAKVFRESLVMAKELAARNPEDPDLQFELAQSHFWVGYAHWRGRELDAALEQFEAYRDISEKLVESDPENPVWKRELAYSYSNLGQTFEEQGRLVEASRALEANARILERLSLQAPEDLSLTSSLARAYSKIGRVAELRGELSQARVRLEAYLTLISKASAARPENTDLQVTMNKALFQVGRILFLQGEPSLASERYDTALEISRRLVAHEPDNQEWLRGLALDLSLSANMLLGRGDLDGASSLVGEVMEIGPLLLRKAPDSPETRYMNAYAFWTRANLRMRRGQLDSARQDLQSGAEMLQRLIQESPSLRYQLWLAKVLEKLGENYQQTGEAARAAETWSQGLLLARELAAAVPSPEHLGTLVEMLVLNQHQEEAAPFIEQLAAMGYRHPIYVDFLDRHGIR